MSRTDPVPALALLAALACEQPSPHVYSSPPPQKSTTVTAMTTAPDIAIGTMGPGARLVAITDAATGAPAALGSVTDSIDVLTLVAFGPGEEASRQGGRVELVVRASTDTTLVLVLPLFAPAPGVVAHAFRVAGLKTARYTVVVRLRTSDGRLLAESIPMDFEVVEH